MQVNSEEIEDLVLELGEGLDGISNPSLSLSFYYSQA